MDLDAPFLASIRASFDFLPPIFRQKVEPHLESPCDWEEMANGGIWCTWHKTVVLPDPDTMAKMTGWVPEEQMVGAREALDAVWDTPEGKHLLDRRWGASRLEQ